jgi:ubiquinone/menaquinone biosynthesis C-methylase UbiE
MCVEIGCGAGRITRQLGKDFKSVCALDVSESMMLKARGACENNVSFCLVEGVKIPLDDDSATAVFSTHVLQHLDSVELGYQYFSEAYRVLRPGATLMIHLPLYQWPNDTGRMGTVWRSLYKWFRRVDDFRADFNRGRGVPIMRGTPYPIMPLTSTLIAIGFHDVQIRIYPTSANEHMHPFVFARK